MHASIPADEPYYAAPDAYFFLSPFTWRDFHTQFPRNTKSHRDHSPIRIWNIVCLCLTENMVMMMLSHPVLSATASFPSTPSENKPSDSSPYPLYTTSTHKPVSAPQKKQAEWLPAEKLRPRGCGPTATASPTAMVAAGLFVMHPTASNCPFHTSEEINFCLILLKWKFIPTIFINAIVFLVKFHSCVTCDMFQISSLEKMYPETNTVSHFLKPFFTVNVIWKATILSNAYKT